jgi:hypothetical protein
MKTGHGENYGLILCYQKEFRWKCMKQSLDKVVLQARRKGTESFCKPECQGTKWRPDYENDRISQ